MDEQLDRLSCGAQFYSRAAMALHALDGLPALRDQVSSLALVPQDSVKAFTDIVVLMSTRNLSEGEAYKLIRKTAMNQNKRIVEVAEAILSMSDILRGVTAGGGAAGGGPGGGA